MQPSPWSVLYRHMQSQMTPSPLERAHCLAASSMSNVSHDGKQTFEADSNLSSMSSAAASSQQPSTPPLAACQAKQTADTAQACEPAPAPAFAVRHPALDHTVYDHQECCSGKCKCGGDAVKLSLPAALLKRRKCKLEGHLLWGATYPIKE